MAEADRIDELGAKLDTLIKLMALSLMSGDQSVKERAVLLNKAGLSPKEIAELCDTTPNTISVALSQVKKEGKTKAGTGKLAQRD